MTVAEQDARVPHRPPVLSSVLVLACVAVAVAVPLSLLVLPGGRLTASAPAVLVVFLAFVAAESIALHFEIRRQAGGPEQVPPAALTGWRVGKPGGGLHP